MAPDLFDGFATEFRIRRWAKWLLVAAYACECVASKVKSYGIRKYVAAVRFTRVDATTEKRPG